MKTILKQYKSNKKRAGSFSLLAILFVSSCQQQEPIKLKNFYEVSRNDAAKLVLVGAGKKQLDFEKTSLNYPARKKITLVNNGNHTATLKGKSSNNVFQFFGGSWPGLSGTCRGTIAPGESCELAISFIPKRVGPQSGSIILSYASGNKDRSIEIKMEGLGVDTPFLYYEHVGSLKFGQVLVQGDDNPVWLIKVKYAGGENKMAQSISGWPIGSGFQYTGSEGYPGTNGTCSSELGASKGECFIEVIFDPSSIGKKTSLLSLDYLNGSSRDKAMIELVGEAENEKTAAVLSITAQTHNNFTVNGLIYPLETKSMIFKVTKTRGNQNAVGVKSLSFSNPSIFSFKGGQFPGEGGTCQANLNSGSCLVVVDFTPQAVAQYSDLIKLNYLDGINSERRSTQISISGGGGEEPVLEFTAGNGSYSFGLVSKNYPQSSPYFYVGIKNSATAVPAINLKTVFSVSQESITPFSRNNHTTCDSSVKTLKFDETCRVRVIFKPTSVTSQDTPIEGSFLVNYNTRRQLSSVKMNLSGVGSAKAKLTYSNTPNFGDIIKGHTSSSKTITINYYGEEPAKLISMETITPFRFAVAANSFPGGGTCPALGGSINSSCTFSTKFLPTSLGNMDRRYKLSYLTGDVETYAPSLSAIREIRMIGRGVNPASIYALNSSIVFNNTVVGKYKDSSFEIRNRWRDYARGRVKAISITGDNFSLLSGGCAVDGYLNTGSKCRIYTRFTPSTKGPKSGQVTVTYDNSNSEEMSFTIDLSGIGITRPLLKVAVDSDDGQFPDTLLESTSEVITMTLSNDGNADLTDLNIDNLNLPTGVEVITNDCLEVIAFGSSCNVKLQFTPLRPGKFTGSLEITSNAPSTRQTFIASGLLDKMVLAAGGGHTCAVNRLGDLYCWGRNDYGQLGLGDKRNRSRGAVVNLGLSVGEYVTELSLGLAHTCALTTEKRVKCWGRNDNGQLGLGDNSSRGARSGEMGEGLSFVSLPGDTEQIIAGFAHTCSILEDKSMKCWGANRQGQLGVQNKSEDQNTPFTVNIVGENIISAALGTAHTCAITESGNLKCWGDNFLGQLGISHASLSLSSLPNVNLGSGRTAFGVSTGGGHTCAYLDNGSVKCWGKNSRGSLGQCWSAIGDEFGECSSEGADDPLLGYGFSEGGQMGDFLSEVNLGKIRVEKIYSGGLYNCVSGKNSINQLHELKCWGDNETGQLLQEDSEHRGDQAQELGDNLETVFPVSHSGLHSIATGTEHACALFDDFSIKCWGSNYFGEGGVAPLSSSEGTQHFGDEEGESLASASKIVL